MMKNAFSRIVLSVALAAGLSACEIGEEPLDETAGAVTLPYRSCSPAGRLCFEEIPLSTMSGDGSWRRGTNRYGQLAWLHDGSFNDVLHIPLYLVEGCSLRSAVIDYTQTRPGSMLFYSPDDNGAWFAQSGRQRFSWHAFSSTLPPVPAGPSPLGGLQLHVQSERSNSSVSRVVIGYSCS